VGLLGVGDGIGVAVAGMGVLVAGITAVFVAWGVGTVAAPSSPHATSKSKINIKLKICFLIATGLYHVSRLTFHVYFHLNGL
jgi:hypothetical protein